MDLNQIAVLIRVIDCGSLSAAARSLRQPKSRVSRRISALEQALGVTLLYRTTRQFSPTEAGLKFYHQCRQQIYDLEAAAYALQDDASEVAGTLKITTTVDMGTMMITPMLAELTTLYPRLSPTLFLSDGVVDLVKDGMDVAIRFGVLKDTTLKARPLGKARFILVASPAYLGRALAIEAVRDLPGQSCLVFGDRNGAYQWQLKNAAGQREMAVVTPSMLSNNMQVLLELALAGKGVALIPEFLCTDFLRASRLQRVLVDYGTEALPVHFVWPATREVSPKLRAFVDMGLERLAVYFSQ